MCVLNAIIVSELFIALVFGGLVFLSFSCGLMHVVVCIYIVRCEFFLFSMSSVFNRIVSRIYIVVFHYYFLIYCIRFCFVVQNHHLFGWTQIPMSIASTYPMNVVWDMVNVGCAALPLACSAIPIFHSVTDNGVINVDGSRKGSHHQGDK